MSAYQVQPDPTDVGGKRLVAAFIDWGIGAVISVVLFVALSKNVSHYSYSAVRGGTYYTTSGS